MKRTFAALFACLAALCVLTACGGSAGNDVTQASDNASPTRSAPITGRSGLDTGEVSAALDANPTRAIRRSIEPIRQTLLTRFDGTSVPENFYLYRNTLSETYQDAYDQICQGIMQQRQSIAMSVPVPTSDLQTVYLGMLYDHPEIFWITLNYSYSYNNNGYVTEVRPQYHSNVDVPAMTAEIEENVEEALAAMWGLGADVEKVKYAHDYLCHTITYQHNDLDQTAYSGFVWRQTVCAGYSECFAYMMHKMGIPCAVVVGMAGGAHAWNFLKLDGEYYMMDVTWDDPDSSPDAYSYNYFNITDSQISADHTRGKEDVTISLALPEANGTAMSYQNAFGGDAYGTDFDAIEGVWPGDDDDDYADDDYDDDDYDDDYDYDYDDDDYDYDDDDYDYDDDDANDDDYDDDDDYDYDDDDYDDDYDYDYDDDDYDYDNDYDYDYDYSDYYAKGEWWKWLDDSWEKSDWEYGGDGYWHIYDDETEFTYMYYENTGVFGAYSEDDPDTVYWLDPDVGEWEETQAVG